MAWVPWALMPVVLAVALAIAHLTYTWIELPTRTWLRNLWPARPALDAAPR
jgi:peptidoglycan/LPS O-acetylase OafA/YrhL